MKTAKRKSHDWIGRGILLAIIGVMAVIIWSLYVYATEEPPLRYTYEDGREAIPFLLEKQEYIGSEEITFDVPKCADRDLTYNFSQRFRNLDTGQPFELLPVNGLSEPKGCKVARSVPKVAHPDMRAGGQDGRYVIEGVVTVKGALRTFEIPFRTIPFNYYATQNGADSDPTPRIPARPARLTPTPTSPTPAPSPTQTVQVTGQAEIVVREEPSEDPDSTPQPTQSSTPTPTPAPSPSPTPDCQPILGIIPCGIL